MSGISDIKHGDHIKVTIEGIAACAPGAQRFVYINSADGGASIGGIYAGREGVTIEKVAKPLPTTPGSTIRSRGSGRTLMRLEDGAWLDQRGIRYPYVESSCFEVLRDAGKDN